MNQDSEERASLPIASTLTPAELASMREGLLPGLLARLLGETDDVPLWLEVTRPEGTEDFLSTLLNTTPPGSPSDK